jgi:hypothetical protein
MSQDILLCIRTETNRLSSTKETNAAVSSQVKHECRTATTTTKLVSGFDDDGYLIVLTTVDDNDSNDSSDGNRTPSHRRYNWLARLCQLLTGNNKTGRATKQHQHPHPLQTTSSASVSPE